jgi:hypothetical protein
MPPDDYTYIPPWLVGTPLGELYNDVWDATGDPVAAIDAVRADPTYSDFFAGNLREDGTVRYSEAEYLVHMESYEDSLVAIGLSRDFIRANFTEQFTKLIEGNVDGTEFWMQRVKPTYDRILQASDEIRAEYAATMGVDLTDEAIISSLIGGDDVFQGLLDQTIAMSEIRGTYSERFEDINGIEADFFEELYKRGDVDVDAARALFTNADTMMPVMSALAARHADADDDFDIYEFTNASVWGDPMQASRMRRLMSQERADFQGASSQVDIVRGRNTGAIGLEVR